MTPTTTTYRWIDLKAVDREPIAPNPVAPHGLPTRRVHVLARVLVHPHPGDLQSHPGHPEHILRRIGFQILKILLPLNLVKFD